MKDDKSSGTEGPIQTQALIEDDKILAFVGHFGTWTIEPTGRFTCPKSSNDSCCYRTNALLTKSRDKEPGNYVCQSNQFTILKVTLMARVMTYLFGAGK